VRPLCASGYCCGSAKAADGFEPETCQLIGTSTVVYRPMRAANATSRKPSETLEFSCIEGARKIVASATALAAAVYMLA